MRILVTGAAGSGTTTLGAALASVLACAHVDSDDFFWLPTTPPYQERRDRRERLAGMLAALEAHPVAVVSGCVMQWGDALEGVFDLVVFLYLDTGIRLQRLNEREIRRFGRADPEFLRWAESYDTGPLAERSLAAHNAWLAQRRCPVLRLEGDLSVEQRLRAVMAQVRARG